MNFIKELITSNELDYVKYGVYLVRKQMSVEKNVPTDHMIENHIPELLLSLMDKYLMDDTITVIFFLISTKFFGA
jgi:hypothetical protein